MVRKKWELMFANQLKDCELIIKAVMVAINEYRKGQSLVYSEDNVFY